MNTLTSLWGILKGFLCLHFHYAEHQDLYSKSGFTNNDAHLHSRGAHILDISTDKASFTNHNKQKENKHLIPHSEMKFCLCHEKICIKSEKINVFKHPGYFGLPINICGEVRNMRFCLVCFFSSFLPGLLQL